MAHEGRGDARREGVGDDSRDKDEEGEGEDFRDGAWSSWGGMSCVLTTSKDSSSRRDKVPSTTVSVMSVSHTWSMSSARLYGTAVRPAVFIVASQLETKSSKLGPSSDRLRQRKESIAVMR